MHPVLETPQWPRTEAATAAAAAPTFPASAIADDDDDEDNCTTLYEWKNVDCGLRCRRKVSSSDVFSSYLLSPNPWCL
ncbi:hypothetical protein TYRP_019398 [Tyrophagus putrescentiae]|nr:hypothetical protein TYRP_019398 [Tyrophagus putrescentiae]